MADAVRSRAATDDKAHPHRIVIVGGGAGGLELATQLGDKLGRRGQAEITLIEKARAHLWKPLLHEIAAGSMDLGHHELDYLAQAHWHHFRYRTGEMIGLDRTRREVLVGPVVEENGAEVTPARAYPYDTLVLAVGSLTNDFGTPGVAEHAICLETPEQAARFHGRLVNACLRAQNQHEPLRPGQLQVAIIGAGATGVELAAELHKSTRELVAFGLDRIDPDRDITLHLIEAADRILPALPPRIATAATDLLTGLGVKVYTSARVAAVVPNGVKLADGRIINASSWSGRLASRRPLFLKTSTASKLTRSISSSCGRRCRPHATTTFSRSAIAPPVPGRNAMPSCRRAPRPRINSRRIWQNSCRADSPASHWRPGTIATSAHWYRSANTAPSAA